MARLIIVSVVVLTLCLLGCSKQNNMPRVDTFTENDTTDNLKPVVHNGFDHLNKGGLNFIDGLREREVYTIASSLEDAEFEALAPEVKTRLQEVMRYVEANYQFDSNGLPLPQEPISRNQGLVIEKNGVEISIHEFLQGLSIADISDMDNATKQLLSENLSLKDRLLLSDEQKFALKSR